MPHWKKGQGKLSFIWVVESRNAKGWSRFTEHQYGQLKT
jgi:hypothetical protein